MDMSSLIDMADLPIWHDGERSSGEYSLPLRANPQSDGGAAPSWSEVAQNAGLLAGIPADEIYDLRGFKCARSPQSHIGPFLNAVDFIVPAGSRILAARRGVIIEVVEKNDEWGDSDQFRDRLNYVTVEHDRGEYSQYCHVGKDTVTGCGLRVGATVEPGQEIGKTGRNGWMDRDHLHFVVFRDDNRNPSNPLTGWKFKSLAIRFK